MRASRGRRRRLELRGRVSQRFPRRARPGHARVRKRRNRGKTSKYRSDGPLVPGAPARAQDRPDSGRDARGDRAGLRNMHGGHSSSKEEEMLQESGKMSGPRPAESILFVQKRSEYFIAENILISPRSNDRTPRPRPGRAREGLPFSRPV